MLQITTIFFLIAASILAVIHAIALKLFLYWRFWWFDIPMHLLGGIVVALGLFTLYDLRIMRVSWWLRPVPALLIVLLVALAWEGYELYIGIPIEDNFAIDTAIDLLMGLLGGYLGWLVGSRIRKLN